MSNTISTRGLALSFLHTNELARLYTRSGQSVVSMPRDFMINTILVREFGRAAYDDHARDLASQYSEYVNNVRKSIPAS